MLDVEISSELLSAMCPGCLTSKCEFGDDLVFRDKDGCRVWKYKNICIAKYDGKRLFLRSWMFSYIPHVGKGMHKCLEYDEVSYRINLLIRFFGE